MNENALSAVVVGGCFFLRSGGTFVSRAFVGDGLVIAVRPALWLLACDNNHLTASSRA